MARPIDRLVQLRRAWLVQHIKTHGTTTIPAIIEAAQANQIPKVPDSKQKATWVIQKDLELLRTEKRIPAGSIVLKANW